RWIPQGGSDVRGTKWARPRKRDPRNRRSRGEAMLVLLSDLHLTDGTSCETLDAEAMAIFIDRLQDLVVRASWRSDGSYRPVPRIEIVLLGDVLDLIRSSRWLLDGPKPWSDPHNEAFVDRVETIVSAILA